MTDVNRYEIEALAAGHDVPLDLAELGHRRPAWMSQGRCRDKPLSWWFADLRTAGGRRDIERARSWCHRCDVQMECHEYAMSDARLVGIFGGLDEKERAAIRRRDRKAG